MFSCFKGFCDGQTNGRTDICECRVAFATENTKEMDLTEYNHRYTVVLIRVRYFAFSYSLTPAKN